MLFLVGMVNATFGLTACGSDHAAQKTAGSISYNTEDIQALAKTVNAEDITMYSTPDCTYCNQAKGWLNQNHLKYTDCDMSSSKVCEQQFHDYKGNGTPLIVVRKNGREHVMHDGFDSDELLKALQPS